MLLAAVTLFAGRPEETDPSAEGVGVALGQPVQKGQEGAHPRCGDDVVTARMPQVRQGVVFGQDGDGAV